MLKKLQSLDTARNEKARIFYSQYQKKNQDRQNVLSFISMFNLRELPIIVKHDFMFKRLSNMFIEIPIAKPFTLTADTALKIKNYKIDEIDYIYKKLNIDLVYLKKIYDDLNSPNITLRHKIYVDCIFDHYYYMLNSQVNSERTIGKVQNEQTIDIAQKERTISKVYSEETIRKVYSEETIGQVPNQRTISQVPNRRTFGQVPNERTFNIKDREYYYNEFNKLVEILDRNREFKISLSDIILKKSYGKKSDIILKKSYGKKSDVEFNNLGELFYSLLDNIEWSRDEKKYFERETHIFYEYYFKTLWGELIEGSCNIDIDFRDQYYDYDCNPFIDNVIKITELLIELIEFLRLDLVLKLEDSSSLKTTL